MKRSGVAAIAVALLASCGLGGAQAIESGGSWQRLPDAPLSPRERSLGVWTGREALVVGGSNAPPTPPGAGTAEPRPTGLLRDGAAFNPRTRSWRRMADAPVALDGLAPATAVRGTVYVAVPRTPGRRDTRMDLVAYRVDRDAWTRLPSPPRRNYTLVAAGARLAAAGPQRGPLPMSVFILNRRERRWTRLPDAPFRGAITWIGGRLVLIGYDPAARNAENPPLARAATLRPGVDAWRRLPDSDHVLWGGGFWVPVGDRLVSPTLGSGSEDYPFGRPFGGILDPERGVWSELPNVPEPTEERGAEFGGGVLTRTRLVGGGPGGLVLDMTREDWVRVPRLWSNRTVPMGFAQVNAGRKLLLFGGARWSRRHPDGKLLNDAWLWTPPAPAG